MPHAHLLYTNRIKRHFTSVSLTTYEKLNSDPLQPIRNVLLSILDFLDSAHPVYHKTRDHLTPQWSSLLHFCMLPSVPPNQTLQVLHFSMASPKPTTPPPSPKPPCNSLFYSLSKIYVPYVCLPLSLQSMLLTCHSPTNQPSNYVTHLITPFEGTLPSYIHYSKHFIQLLEFPQTYPGNIFPHPFLVCYFTGSYFIGISYVPSSPAGTQINLIPVVHLKL